LSYIVTMNDAEYVAGVCNIGPAEIARRRVVGWIGLVVTLAVFAGLAWAGVDRWWRLVVFLPATISASGFLQARSRFCVGFARMSVSNFGDLGQTQAVDSEVARKADRARGARLTFYAVLIGLAAAIVAVAATGPRQVD